jgi:hypothetical protein
MGRLAGDEIRSIFAEHSNFQEVDLAIHPPRNCETPR